MDFIIEHQLMHCIECGLELSSDEQIHGRNYCDGCLLKIYHAGNISVFDEVKNRMEKQ